MEWVGLLAIVVGALLVLLLIGVPVAFAFIAVNAVAVFALMGGEAGLMAFTRSMMASLTVFTLVPIPLFVLMGALLFHSGLALKAVTVVSTWLGRMPGRLSVIAGTSGALFAAVSGSTIGNTALLGSMLLPEMRERGYSKQLSIGPIMASGGLAMIIPPSALAVLYGSIAGVSIGRLLIAGIIPGIIMGTFYATYTIGRAWLNPSMAPPFEASPLPLRERLRRTLTDLVPIGGLIVLVTGSIFSGVATPTESAALGSVGAAVLPALYGRLNFDVLTKALRDTVTITGMTFLIIAGAQAFSQVLAFSGASRGLVQTVSGLDVRPIFILLAMQLLVLVLGSFLDQVSIMMVTIPLFGPVVVLLGLDPIWFGIIMLINLQVALTTPPLGLLLFVMKGVVPADTSMGDIYRASIPYIVCDFCSMALLIAFPTLVTWLPSLM